MKDIILPAETLPPSCRPSVLVAPLLLGFRRSTYAILAMCTASIVCLLASSNAHAQLPPHAIQLTVDGKPNEARIEVRTTGPRRIVFSTLRSTVPLARMEVLSPSGDVVQSGTGKALERLPAAQAAHPELGAVYQLQEIRNAAAGTWRIRFIPASTKRGTILGAYSIRPRYELLLPISPLPTNAGERTVIEVLATDNGEAMSGIPGIRLWIEDASGRTVILTRARAGLRNANGILLNLDDHVYLAVTTLPAPGRYRVMAAHDFGAGDVIATLPLVVK